MWQEERRLTCPSCGTTPWEWEEDPNAWVADAYRCPGCERVDAATRTLRMDLDSRPPSDEDGLSVRLFKEVR